MAGIGCRLLNMLLPRQARFGDATTPVGPKQLHDVCEKHNIYVLKQRQHCRLNEGRRRPPLSFRGTTRHPVGAGRV